MKTLTDEDVLNVMREQWTRRVNALSEQIDMTMNSRIDDHSEVPVLAPELKVRHKGSQIRYTICSAGPRDVILRTPEGEQFLVNKEEFEENYILD